MWKIKRLINKLENCKGNGTSMVSLIVPPKEDINKSGKMLAQELSAANNIKSRITRQSVITAITSTRESKLIESAVGEFKLLFYRVEALQTDS
jgi:peptide chain release factor subunit 1